MTLVDQEIVFDHKLLASKFIPTTRIPHNFCEDCVKEANCYRNNLARHIKYW
jgi:hypothetical protein